MHAIVHERYGSPDVLEFRDIEIPSVPDDRVLIRVKAASLNAYDWHILRGDPYVVRTSEGWRRPNRLVAGVDMAGIVEAVGADVTDFRPGDEVFGERGGAFAEFVTARANDLAPKPANLTFEQAAAVPMAGFTALQALRDKGKVKPGQRVLVTGSAGGVGTFAVQLAKSLGAIVTGECHTSGVDLVSSIGADEVVDYSRADVTRGTARFDLVLDIAAVHPLRALRRVMTAEGVLVVVGAPKGRWFAPLRRPLGAVILSRFGSQRLLPFLAERRKSDLLILRDRIEAGDVRPVIDSTYPLAAAADAFRRLEAGHVRGKVVITI
jgi:NADPH:quinone reductase-like Zn-dependent oxidoreductase